MTETRELERQRDDVRRTVFAGIARRRVVRKRQQILAVAAGGLLLAAGVGVGAAKLVTPTVQQNLHQAVCYTSASTDEAHYFDNVDEAPYDVVELCQEMWKRGVIGQTPRPADPNDMSANYPVPDIAVCLDRDGFRSGFPIWDDAETPQQLCDRLGLPLLE